MLNREKPAQDPVVALPGRPGALPLESYAALGDGRSVALVGLDGSIDWWCVPNMNSAPMLDRVLDEARGGYFSLTPLGEYTATRAYRPDSNVLETVFETPNGRQRKVAPEARLRGP